MIDLIDKRIQEYAETHTSPEGQVLAELNQLTQAKFHTPQMLSGHMQGRILAMLSRLVRPQQVLEIGTYTGYAAICLAEGLADGGKLYTLDKDDRVKDVAEEYFKKAGMADKIDLLFGDAMELIPGLSGPFDLVFIDADKRNYPSYFDMVIDKLRTGGLIIADNVLWSGRVVEAEMDDQTRALDHYNKKILADNRVHSLLLPVRDGLNIAQKIV